MACTAMGMPLSLPLTESANDAEMKTGDDEEKEVLLMLVVAYLLS